jgi:hypothetical protein
VELQLMMEHKTLEYVYTYLCHEDERDLCELEIRSLFGITPNKGWFVSPLCLDPSRSPFIKARLSVMTEGGNIQDIAEDVKQLDLRGETFKVVFIECGDSNDYNEQRAIEREVGLHIRGKAEMRKPSSASCRKAKPSGCVTMTSRSIIPPL